MSDIKFGTIGNFGDIKSTPRPHKNPSTDNQQAPEGVKVHLESLAELMKVETSPDEAARVAEMKNQIQSGQYRIDTDKLSKQLYHQVFKNINHIG